MKQDKSSLPSTTIPSTISKPKRSMFDGRMNRKAYFLGHLILIGILVIIILLYALINFIFNDTINPSTTTATFVDPNPIRSVFNISLFLITTIYIIFSIFVIFSLNIRRLHDINTTGWLSILILINPAALILYVVLQAVEGTEGPNKYGPGEQPSTVSTILGLKR